MRVVAFLAAVTTAALVAQGAVSSLHAAPASEAPGAHHAGLAPLATAPPASRSEEHDAHACLLCAALLHARAWLAVPFALAPAPEGAMGPAPLAEAPAARHTWPVAQRGPRAPPGSAFV